MLINAHIIIKTVINTDLSFLNSLTCFLCILADRL